MTDRERRLSFGGVAGQYDQARPDYPAELIDDLITDAGCRPGEEVLEIGAGTGKATRMVCARHLSVLAVEPDAEMAAVASRQAATAAHNVRVVESDFESADLPRAAFPLAYSAQAWHWVDPETGYERAHRALRPGGVLAAFWNRIDWSGHALVAEIDEAYERSGAGQLAHGRNREANDPGRPPDSWDPERARAAGFGEPSAVRYERVLEYSAQEYAALLATHSDHILLAPDVRQVLLEEIAAVIDRHGGTLRLDAPTWLCQARAHYKAPARLASTRP